MAHHSENNVRYKYIYVGSHTPTSIPACNCAAQPLSTPDTAYPNKDADSDRVNAHWDGYVSLRYGR